MSIGYIIQDIGTQKRQRLVKGIRRKMLEYDVPEVTGVKFINGRVHDLDAEMESMGVRLGNGGAGMHKGEIGLWLSTINSLRAIADSEYENVIVFEDDAVVRQSFPARVQQVFAELPDDYDFFSWHVPKNQRQDYYYDRWFDDNGAWTMNLGPPLKDEESPHYIPGNEYVCTAYQGYGGIALMYSKKGAGRVLELVDQTGILGPTDCVLFTKSHTGYLGGYTFRPHILDVITYKETGTTVRSTGMYV